VDDLVNKDIVGLGVLNFVLLVAVLVVVVVVVVKKKKEPRDYTLGLNYALTG